jgi:hypothetical protein
MPLANDGWETVSDNPPYGIVHWPTMSLPPPPPPLQPPQLIAYVASHVHHVQIPKNYKELVIEPQPSKGKHPSISFSYDPRDVKG